jgi:hypothetical protein
LSLQIENTSEQLTFAAFISAFPYPKKSALHFRFRVKVGDGYGWQDINAAKHIIPTYQRSIMAKVLRLDETLALKGRTRLRRKKNALKGTANFFSDSQYRAKQPEKPRPPAYSDATCTQGQQMQSDEKHRPSSPAPEASVDVNSSKSHKEELTPPVPPVYVEKVLNREDLAAAREKEIEDKVKEGLEFKAELDEAARKETEDLEAAKAKYDQVLTKWAMNNTERKNVRSLLTSMHTVLWEGHKWKEISLGDVIESKRVKLYYRKAMLVVHPDKTAGCEADVRFRAKRIFEAVNEAYQEFLKKEGLSG